MLLDRLQRSLRSARPVGPAAPVELDPREAFACDALHRLVAHWPEAGHFAGALPADLPKMLTEDGIEVACHPDLLVGITAARTAFGIELAAKDVFDLTHLVDRALAPLPHPDWTPDLVTEHAQIALVVLPGGSVLRLTCLPCRVDPCFNGQREDGVRLIGHVQRD